MSGRRQPDDRPRPTVRDLRTRPPREQPARDARPHSPREQPLRVGPHLGPVRITPIRATLTVALIGGLAFLAYSVLVRDALQVPLMATGFGIVGLVLGAVSVMAVGSVLRAGREGRDGVAVLTALLGGFMAVGSLLSLAIAVIMGLIWSGTKTS